MEFQRHKATEVSEENVEIAKKHFRKSPTLPSNKKSVVMAWY